MARSDNTKDTKKRMSDFYLERERELIEIMRVVGYLYNGLVATGYTKERMISDISEVTGIREERVVKIFEKVEKEENES